jgi:myo-inositol-1(or 4)-monophosphatase
MDYSRLKEIHDFLIVIAHKAGETILAAKPSTGTTDSKKNSMLLHNHVYRIQS